VGDVKHGCRKHTLSLAFKRYFLTPVQSNAHLLRWALLFRNFAGTPRDPDGVSIAARHPLARIPIAHWEGLRSPRMGLCERALPDTNRCTDFIVTRQWLVTTLCTR